MNNDTSYWKNDRPETIEQALELLRFGAVMNHITDPVPINQRRTERRMLACADFFERTQPKPATDTGYEFGLTHEDVWPGDAGLSSEAEEVERLRDDNQRFRNGYANLMNALQNAPGLPLEGSSEEALVEWTNIIAGILFALGTLEATGKPQSPWEALLAIGNASSDTNNEV